MEISKLGVVGFGLAIRAGASSYFYLVSDYTIEQLLNREKWTLNEKTIS